MATKTLAITGASGPMEVTASPDRDDDHHGHASSGSASNLADETRTSRSTRPTSGSRTSDWYGTFTGVTNSLSNLRVSYTGKNSRYCTQMVFIWRWTTSSWVELSSRTVGTTEVSIANLAPSGTLADYVSGTRGDGDVRVRVRCRRSSQSFFASGDLLRISYVRAGGVRDSCRLEAARVRLRIGDRQRLEQGAHQRRRRLDGRPARSWWTTKQ